MAIVALDMNTGAMKWSTRALPVDAWNVTCGIPVPGWDLVFPDLAPGATPSPCRTGSTDRHRVPGLLARQPAYDVGAAAAAGGGAGAVDAL